MSSLLSQNICTFHVFSSSVREFMDFTAKLLVERTQVGLRASVKEQGETLYQHVKSYFNFFILSSINKKIS